LCDCCEVLIFDKNYNDVARVKFSNNKIKYLAERKINEIVVFDKLQAGNDFEIKGRDHLGHKRK